jgi:rhamnosyltransferase subunit B
LIDHRLAAGINAFRRTLGLPPVRGFQSRWLHSPDGVLGLFPAWFASPQPDWPPHVHLTGFPIYDDAAEDPLTPELGRFLDAGEPPIIFTIGSTLQAKWFFDAAVEACERLQCRGLLINRFFDQRRRDLPQILHTAYVPYNTVFPRCQAVVHHGGIGTTSQAMAAGVPQLIVPMCADQPDNALRVERLGVGFQFARADFDGLQLSENLRRLLNDEAFTKQARVIASRVDGREAVAAACDVIEQVFQQKMGAP